jgi:hypothetical protein
VLKIRKIDRIFTSKKNFFHTKKFRLGVLGDYFAYFIFLSIVIITTYSFFSFSESSNFCKKFVYRVDTIKIEKKFLRFLTDFDRFWAKKNEPILTPFLGGGS